MPNILSKQYQGLVHFAIIVLALAANVLTNPQLVDLGWTWVGPAAAAIPPILLFLQRFTPVGDTKP